MGALQVHVRNKLVAGALAAIPLVVTVFILWYVDSKARAIFNVDQPLVGIGIALAGLYLLGLFVTSFVGHFVLGAIDAVLRRLPGLRDLYRSWKQVALTTDTHDGIFAHVVLIPGDGGTRALGFTSAKGIEGDAATWCVFVPASPNPTSGRLFFVPSRACLLVDMTSQEALKLVISGGSYVPGAIGGALATHAAIERAENTAPLTLP
ncbi:MAG TPA: DUF502 domain-containing protein [Polyangia bacterium]|jgi:uncharacterized membrane protein|nr:DUF502 domain-containing protein [Polyangia bacterium]